MRERCVSGRDGTCSHGTGRRPFRPGSDVLVPDTKAASGITRQDPAGTFNPSVVGSSPTRPTGCRRGVHPPTCCAAPEPTSVGSGAASFSGTWRERYGDVAQVPQGDGRLSGRSQEPSSSVQVWAGQRFVQRGAFGSRSWMQPVAGRSARLQARVAASPGPQLVRSRRDKAGTVLFLVLMVDSLLRDRRGRRPAAVLAAVRCVERGSVGHPGGGARSGDGSRHAGPCSAPAEVRAGDRRSRAEHHLTEHLVLWRAFGTGAGSGASSEWLRR